MTNTTPVIDVTQPHPVYIRLKDFTDEAFENELEKVRTLLTQQLDEAIELVPILLRQHRRSSVEIPFKDDLWILGIVHGAPNHTSLDWYLPGYKEVKVRIHRAEELVHEIMNKAYTSDLVFYTHYSHGGEFYRITGVSVRHSRPRHRSR